MIELGKRQTLKVVKKVDFGIYLAEEQSLEAERVLLPKKQVPEGTEIGSEVEVFVYKDSQDRMISTVREPLLSLGEVGVLKVTEVGKIGGFLEWGLEKELLLPFKEQTKRVHEGEEVLVSVYIDKSSRLCGTMKVYPYLSLEAPYAKEERVKGRVYEISDNFGAFVAVDDKYSALIPKKEFFGQLKVGDLIEARVTEVKEDGKLNLSVREKAYLQIDKDAEHVMEIIEEFDGVLPFNDKVSPEIIEREMKLSKNAFKRAVGHLLKNQKIEITGKTIRKK